MFVGFSAYLLLLGFTRGLVTSPLVASSAADHPGARLDKARSAVTFTLTVACLAACCLGVLGAALPPRLGTGILLFAPWLVPALVQDLGRSIVFRDLRGRSTVLSDAAWLVVMAALAPLALASHSGWIVAACWGAGATFGAGTALKLIGFRPTAIRQSVGWWRSDAWPFGRWLFLSGSLYSVSSYASVLALAGILGARDYGGLRAVQSIFGPLTLIGPAITLPGLPLMSRAIAESSTRGLGLAWRLAGLVTAVTAVYVGLLYEFPDILGFAFGGAFRAFQGIILPIGVGQLLAAPRVGLTLFLTAHRRGRALSGVGAINALLLMALSIVLGSTFGLRGAAWAGAVSSALGGIVVIAVLYQPGSRKRAAQADAW